MSATNSTVEFESLNRLSQNLRAIPEQTGLQVGTQDSKSIPSKSPAFPACNRQASATSKMLLLLLSEILKARQPEVLSLVQRIIAALTYAALMSIFACVHRTAVQSIRQRDAASPQTATGFTMNQKLPILSAE